MDWTWYTVDVAGATTLSDVSRADQPGVIHRHARGVPQTLASIRFVRSSRIWPRSVSTGQRRLAPSCPPCCVMLNAARQKAQSQQLRGQKAKTSRWRGVRWPANCAGGMENASTGSAGSAHARPVFGRCSAGVRPVCLATAQPHSAKAESAQADALFRAIGRRSGSSGSRLVEQRGTTQASVCVLSALPRLMLLMR